MSKNKWYLRLWFQKSYWVELRSAPSRAGITSWFWYWQDFWSCRSIDSELYYSRESQGVFQDWEGVTGKYTGHYKLLKMELLLYLLQVTLSYTAWYVPRVILNTWKIWDSQVIAGEDWDELITCISKVWFNIDRLMTYWFLVSKDLIDFSPDILLLLFFDLHRQQMTSAHAWL